MSEQLLNLIYGVADAQMLFSWIFRICLSFICGVCIGWERKNRQQIIGIRTLLLICISSTLLGILSEYSAISIPGGKIGDPSRISAAVITGIGFVGGGAIMHRGFNVKGVTTAALIWATSAIGLALGDGLYIPALFVFVLILISLPAFQKFEAKHFQTGKIKVIKLLYSGDILDYKKAISFMEELGILIHDVNVKTNEKEKTVEITFYVYAPKEMDFVELNSFLKGIGNLESFSFSEV